MSAIKIGKYLNTILKSDERLKSLVGNKIYPLIVDNDITFPFVVYSRGSIEPQYTKDFHLNDIVTIDIYVVSTTYLESLDIADIIRDILEDKTYSQYNWRKITLDYVDESYSDDSYVQTLGFKITVNK